MVNKDAYNLRSDHRSLFKKYLTVEPTTLVIATFGIIAVGYFWMLWHESLFEWSTGSTDVTYEEKFYLSGFF